jgi:hypothetical protein
VVGRVVIQESGRVLAGKRASVYKAATVVFGILIARGGIANFYAD